MSHLFGRRTRLRWVYQVVGGALLMPYFFVALATTQIVDVRRATHDPALLQLAAFLVAIPLVAVTGFFPLVHTVEVSIARVLLGGPVADLPSTARRSWRTAAWYLLHLGVGGLVSGACLAVPPAAVVLMVRPLLPHRPWVIAEGSLLDLGTGWSAPVGVAMLAAVLFVVAGTGAGLARLAPVLLGPSPADRLAALERRNAKLAERNRLARELHDSVGHALSIVTVQATAADRVLDRDPEFARQALGAIAATARDALADLDHVLGLLREEEPAGRAGKAASRDGELPGRDVEPVARDGELPGRDVEPVARDGELPGRDVEPVARDGEPPGRDVEPVARDGQPPGRDADAPSRGGEPADRAAPPSLADLDRLVAQARIAGVEVQATVSGTLDRVPPEVSREAYRIVQEGLTNALRHAGPVPLSLRVDATPDRLALELTNPLGAAPPVRPSGGGRGLTGITERVTVLRGQVSAAAEDGRWRLAVELPLRAPR